MSLGGGIVREQPPWHTVKRIAPGPWAFETEPGSLGQTVRRQQGFLFFF